MLYAYIHLSDFALCPSQVIGGDIKKVGHTSSAADPDGVVDLVKVLCDSKKVVLLWAIFPNFFESCRAAVVFRVKEALAQGLFKAG